MNVLKTAALEVYGLFVEDGSYAVAILVWIAVATLLLPRLPASAIVWSGPVFFVGLAAILVQNVLKTARWRRK
jgi:hypothetical protein